MFIYTYIHIPGGLFSNCVSMRTLWQGVSSLLGRFFTAQRYIQLYSTVVRHSDKYTLNPGTHVF